MLAESFAGQWPWTATLQNVSMPLSLRVPSGRSQLAAVRSKRSLEGIDLVIKEWYGSFLEFQVPSSCEGAGDGGARK